MAFYTIDSEHMSNSTIFDVANWFKRMSLKPEENFMIIWVD